MTNETQGKGKEEAILEIIVQQTLGKTNNIHYHKLQLFQVLLSSPLNLVFLFTYFTALVTKFSHKECC